VSSSGDPDDGAERRAFAARAGRRRPKGRSRNRGRRTCHDRSVGRRGTDRHPRGPALLVNCLSRTTAGQDRRDAPPSIRTRDRRSSICIVPAPVFGRRIVRPHQVHGSTLGPERVNGPHVGRVEPLRWFVVGRCAHRAPAWWVESTQATHQRAAARKPGLALPLCPPTHWKSTPLAVVLPHELRHLKGFDRGVDADGRGGGVVAFAILAHDQPSAVCPLHDFRMVNLAHPVPHLLPRFGAVSTEPIEGQVRRARPLGRSSSGATIW